MNIKSISITPPALRKLHDYAHSQPGTPLEDDIMIAIICTSLEGFVNTFKDCHFFTRYERHSFGGACYGVPNDKYTNVQFYHVERRPKGWLIGVPEEMPLAPGYEEIRVVEEAAMALNASEA